jgi:YD repeat-containing protein
MRVHNASSLGVVNGANIQSYGYDALGRRILRRFHDTTSTAEPFGRPTYQWSYDLEDHHTPQWQVAYTEKRPAPSGSGRPSALPYQRHIHGLSYVDPLGITGPRVVRGSGVSGSLAEP